MKMLKKLAAVSAAAMLMLLLALLGVGLVMAAWAVKSYKKNA